ncbi:MAG: PIG-L deacetylase family protein [Faecalimonas sp.]|nr:PIG-L deacetylase family protein [Faecalimonas sp.]
MKYLVVVAHPDDEVLGAGATIKKLTDAGHTVDLCIMCTEVRARACRPEDAELNCDIDANTKLLGIHKRYEGSFPNIEMNVVPHLQLVQFVEKAIVESEPDVVITHHPSDTNNDHMHTSTACQAAIRIFQRRKDVKAISEFWFMETLSATEWSVNTAMNRFAPNTYIEIGKENLELKLKALATYRGVMREYPHPRSNEAITGLAAYRGGQSGCDYAEAFECVLRRVTIC